MTLMKLALSDNLKASHELLDVIYEKIRDGLSVTIAFFTAMGFFFKAAR